MSWDTSPPRARLILSGVQGNPHLGSNDAHLNSLVFAIHEVQQFLIGQGVQAENCIGLNIGGTVDVGGGFKATMVSRWSPLCQCVVSAVYPTRVVALFCAPRSVLFTAEGVAKEKR